MCFEGNGTTLGTYVEANAAVKSGPGDVLRLTITSDGTGGYVKVYDAGSATGTPIWQMATPASATWTEHVAVMMHFKTGCYVEVSHAKVMVTYY